jgi:uncharacterized membrane protein YtjA (UPF0391 family)
MLRASIMFFIFGIVFYILGAYQVAGLSLGIGRFILVTFILLSLISFIVMLFTGKNTKILN